MTPGNDKKVHDARLYIKGQSFHQAREILEFVIADEPSNLEALYLQALCFYYTKDYRRTENLLSQVCRQPDADEWSALHKLLLISLLYQKKYNEAELVARKTMIKKNTPNTPRKILRNRLAKYLWSIISAPPIWIAS